MRIPFFRFSREKKAKQFASPTRQRQNMQKCHGQNFCGPAISPAAPAVVSKLVFAKLAMGSQPRYPLRLTCKCGIRTGQPQGSHAFGGGPSAKLWGFPKTTYRTCFGHPSRTRKELSPYQLPPPCSHTHGVPCVFTTQRQLTLKWPMLVKPTKGGIGDTPRLKEQAAGQN